MKLSDFPARRLAGEGGAFFADQWTGDDAERCALLEAGHAAVVGSGGYDLDGRSWVVAVFADASARLDYCTLCWRPSSRRRSASRVRPSSPAPWSPGFGRS